MHSVYPTTSLLSTCYLQLQQYHYHHTDLMIHAGTTVDILAVSCPEGLASRLQGNQQYEQEELDPVY